MVKEFKLVQKNNEEEIEHLKSVIKEMRDEKDTLNEQKSALTDKMNDYSAKILQKSQKIT